MSGVARNNSATLSIYHRTPTGAFALSKRVHSRVKTTPPKAFPIANQPPQTAAAAVDNTHSNAMNGDRYATPPRNQPSFGSTHRNSHPSSNNASQTCNGCCQLFLQIALFLVAIVVIFITLYIVTGIPMLPYVQNALKDVPDYIAPMQQLLNEYYQWCQQFYESKKSQYFHS